MDSKGVAINFGGCRMIARGSLKSGELEKLLQFGTQSNLRAKRNAVEKVLNTHQVSENLFKK